MNRVLADTTILVENLRGNEAAKNFLEKGLPAISSVTIAELIQGCRDKRELRIVKNACRDLPEISISKTITARSLILLERYCLSAGLKFLDALIAATALENRLTLLTGNIKHFSFIQGLRLREWPEP